MVHKTKKAEMENWGGVIGTKSGEIIEVPSYIQIMSKNRLKVRTQDWSGSHVNIITKKDVENYYKTEARNIMSGFRQLGSIGGDWRMIDNLAEETKYIFEKLGK
jgi:hypothetical protein